MKKVTKRILAMCLIIAAFCTTGCAQLSEMASITTFTSHDKNGYITIEEFDDVRFNVHENMIEKVKEIDSLYYNSEGETVGVTYKLQTDKKYLLFDTNKFIVDVIKLDEKTNIQGFTKIEEINKVLEKYAMTATGDEIDSAEVDGKIKYITEGVYDIQKLQRPKDTMWGMIALYQGCQYSFME